MFCTGCGKEIPSSAQVCPYCNQQVVNVNPAGPGGNAGGGYAPNPGGNVGGGYVPNPGQNAGYGRTRSRIDNIFSSLIYDKRTGDIAEFVLWCGVCVTVLLFFLATVLTGDKELSSRYTDGFRATWIFMMIFAMGLGTAMVFRKIKPIMIYGAQVAIQFIMLIPYYVTITGRMDDVGRKMNVDIDVPGVVIALFILIMLTVLGMVACSSIHFFSKINLGNVISILSIVYSGLLLFLAFTMYFLPCFEYDDETYYLFKAIKEIGEKYTSGWGWIGSCYWLGSIAFFLISAIITVYTVLYFRGIIDHQKSKIYVLTGGGKTVRMPQIQCVRGCYQGQVFFLQNAEFSIGSQQGVSLVIMDNYVSRLHCTIRFNPSTGNYEVRDLSTNGVYLLNGYRLEKNMYTPLKNGTVICIGSVNQQFKLG